MMASKSFQKMSFNKLSNATQVSKKIHFLCHLSQKNKKEASLNTHEKTLCVIQVINMSGGEY